MDEPDRAAPLDALALLRLDFNESALEWAMRSLDATTLGDHARATRCLEIALLARRVALRVPTP